jgi:hypothetical protein
MAKKIFFPGKERPLMPWRRAVAGFPTPWILEKIVSGDFLRQFQITRISPG